MTRFVIDVLFWGGLFFLTPLSAALLIVWCINIWRHAHRQQNYSIDRLFLLALPGIALMVLLMIPVWYSGALRKADEFCLHMHDAQATQHPLSASQKSRLTDDMRHYCPHSDVNDLMRRRETAQ